MSESPPPSKQEIAETQSDPEKEQTPAGVWETPIIRKENGEAIGISIFLGDKVLRDLDVDIESEERLKYQITERNRVQIGNIVEDWSND